MKTKIITLALISIIGANSLSLAQSITKKDIRKIVKSEIKKSLSKTIIPQGERGAQGPTGAVGPQGAKGERGETGPQGERGFGVFDNMPSGEIIKGIVGLTSQAPNLGRWYAFGDTQTFPVKIGAKIDPARVYIRLNDDFISACERDYGTPGSGGYECLSEIQREKIADAEANCNGDWANPDPAPGALCIYPNQVYNVTGIHAKPYPQNENNVETTGFEVFWQANDTGKNESVIEQTTFIGIYAYRAP